MREFHWEIQGRPVTVLVCRTAVLGAGAAGFAAAWRLAKLRQDADVVLLCGDRQAGTSRNAGSDKQTYYRLGGVNAPDSVAAMARDLTEGGAADGDLALTEAALSARCFYALTELGVAFPCDAYGRYVGYRTDHDPAARASSVGPYTSRAMTEALERAAAAAGVPVCEGWQAVRLLTRPMFDGVTAKTEKADASAAVCGVLCIDEKAEYRICLCSTVVLATGGPADIWQHSVYPVDQTGASAPAFEAGAWGRNLTEWQFGMASLSPRWNVSGSYMQALPRFFSRDADGREHDFLLEACGGPDGFADPHDLLDNIFLKGYQWPFDARRAANGSSRVDLAVLRQQQLGRRVYLDFTREPTGHEPDWNALAPETRDYLAHVGACVPSPASRLARLNRPALAFYAERGVDLTAQPLEIGVCAQHCNGGIAVDSRYRTAVEGLFCVGEAAATHGVRRPGGSALNAGQVGALRAAQYIAARRSDLPIPDERQARELAETEMVRQLTWEKELLCSSGPVSDPLQTLALARAVTDRAGGILRQTGSLEEALGTVRGLLADLHAPQRAALPAVFRLRNALVTQIMVLRAMQDYAEKVGVSRGSALYADANGRYLPEPPRPAEGLRPDERQVQELVWANGAGEARWRPTRPIPAGDLFFENVWQRWRETGGIE